VKRFLFLITLSILIVLPHHARADVVSSRWSDLGFLIGDWDTEPTKTIKSGTFSLTEDLGGTILVRRNHAEYVPKPGEEQGIVHDDYMVLYNEDGKHRAMFVDPEGHVIHYSVSTAEHTATFESDPVPNAPRYKLVYNEEKPGHCAVQFYIQPPGGSYEMYVSGKVKRRSTKSQG
jgi:hypothetical protein